MLPHPIRPGLFHWTARHANNPIEVSSCWLAGPRLLLDPLLPERGTVSCASATRHGLPLIGHGKDELRAFTEGWDFARAAARADGSTSAASAGGRVARMRIRCAERAEEPNRYECLHCASPTACALASVRFVT